MDTNNYGHSPRYGNINMDWTMQRAMPYCIVYVSMDAASTPVQMDLPLKLKYDYSFHCFSVCVLCNHLFSFPCSLVLLPDARL